jgi:O-antigen/teichoic acid export membrane protein
MPTETTRTAATPRDTLPIGGALLARNTILNFICSALPLAIGIVSIPYVIHRLGLDRFGVLSLSWIIAGYFNFLNLGLGPATTKFVAELLGSGDSRRLPIVVWTSVLLSTILGALAAVALSAATPLVIRHVFKVSPTLIGEARLVFLLIAISFPVVFAMGPLRGVLEAAQRFDLTNAVALPVNSANFLIPAVAVGLGFGLPAIVGFLLLSRLLAVLAYLVLGLRLFPSLGRALVFDGKALRALLRFGGWVSVANMVAPAITYLDRFLIGALVSVAAVGYYAAPYEALSRTSVFPGALVGVLFPAFSALGASRRQADIEDFFARSVRYVMLGMGVPAILLVFFARDILGMWLGSDFVNHSAWAFQLISLAVLLSSVFWVPHVLLQAVGRPDIPTKFVLLELPFYVGLAWLLISRLGITGAALAWTIRVAVHAGLLTWMCGRLRFVPLRSWLAGGMASTLSMLAGLAVLLAGLSMLRLTLPARAAVVLLMMILFGLAAWRHALQGDEKQSMGRGLKRVGRFLSFGSVTEARSLLAGPGRQSAGPGLP